MRLNFSSKIALVTFIISIIGVLIISFISLSLMTKYFKENSLENLNIELNSDCKNIKSSIDKLTYDASILSNSDDLIDYYLAFNNKKHYDAISGKNLNEITNSLQEKFVSILAHNKSYLNVSLILHNGQELIMAYKDMMGIHLQETNKLQNISDEKYFLKASKLPDTAIYISNINLKKEFGNISYPLTPTIKVAIPIYLSYKLFALIVINSDMNTLSTILKQYENNKSTKSIYIANKDGFYIYNKDKSKIFANEFGHNKYNLFYDFKINKKGYCNNNFIFAYKKLYYTKKKFLYVALKENNIFSKEQYKEFLKSLTIYTIIIALIIALISLIVVRYLIAPIIKITKKAQKIANGNIEKNIEFEEVYTNDEIQELSHALKIMLNNLEESKKEIEQKVQERTKELNELNENLEEIVKAKTDENIKQLEILQQQNKLASMGEMIGAIAHQWRQPLNELGIAIQNLKYDYEDGLITKEYLNEFISSTKKVIKFMSDTIDDFRNFYRVDKTKEIFSLKNAIKRTLSIQKAQLNNHNIKIELIGEDFEINGYKNEFQQVILNLINNAKDILVEKKIKNGKIIIELKDKTVFVRDNGGGVPDNVIKRVFEPYFTTKEQGKGTGMGLYMSKMIIEENMKAILDVRNTKNGAEFRIDFNE